MKALLDDNTMAPWRGTEPGTVVFGELEIRSAHTKGERIAAFGSPLLPANEKALDFAESEFV